MCARAADGQHRIDARGSFPRTAPHREFPDKAFQFGRSKAKLISPDKPQVTFADVGGLAHVKKQIERRIIMPEDYPDHPLRKDFDVEGGRSDVELPNRPVSPGFRDMEHA